MTARISHPPRRSPAAPAPARRRLAALALAAWLAGCGGSSDDDPAPPPVAGNTAPTAAFAAVAAAVVGEPVVFDASASADADGDPLVHGWDFGNGLRGGGVGIAHVYDEPGTYTVALTVADGRGGTAVAQRTLTVAPGAAAAGRADTLAVVRDGRGSPLSGVSVTSVAGGAAATTGADGRATLDTPTGKGLTLKFSRDGYADQFKRLDLPAGTDEGYLQVTMLPREAPLTLPDAAVGGTLDGKDGVRLTLPAGSLVDAAGRPVSGPVQVSMTPVDVGAEARHFPGRFEGVGPDGAQGLILSYGTVEFLLTQDGAPLQLAAGRTATIEIPVYTALDRDGRALQVDDTYPLWSLNERTGGWVQEGSGTVVAAATPSGLALRGEVTHFSWWNHDVFDVPPYRPKPRCLVDFNYDGVPDDLTGTGYCSHEASPFWDSQQTSTQSIDRRPLAATRGTAAAVPLADPEPRTRRIPVWVASATTPADGGVELPVPADLDVVFQSYAQNGTLYGRTLVRGASGASDDVVVLLSPVEDASGTVTISEPWDRVYAMSHVGETDRFALAAQAGGSYTITAGRSNGSMLGGGVIVRDPAGAVVGSASMGGGAASVAITNAVAGIHTVEVTATANAPGAYRLQALEVVAAGNCATVTTLTLPTDATHALGGNSVQCFAVDLSADQVIDIDLPSRGSLGGALQLRAPDGGVIARDSFQSGVVRVPVLRLAVAQAGRYQLEIVNEVAASGTVRLRGGWLPASQITLPQEVSATDMGSSDTRRYVLRQPTPGAAFATALTACNGNFTAAVYPARTFTNVNIPVSCASSRALRIQAHAMHPLVLPVIEVTRGSTTLTTPGEFTLVTSTPTPLTLDTDVRLTAPPRDRAVAYTFDGTAGQEVTIGTDIPGTSDTGAVVARINAPSGSLVSASGSPATLKLPAAGLYTVEVPNTSTYTGSVRIRVNSVAPPLPLTLTAPLTERTDTLALGQVRVYAFDLDAAEVFRLRLASPDTLAVSASVGGVAPGTVSVTLSGAASPQFGASSQQGYARTAGTRQIVVSSTSGAEAKSTGAFTIGVQKPDPVVVALGTETADALAAREMRAHGYAIAAAGYHLLRWRHTPVGFGEFPLTGTLWAPSTPFANYTGEYSLSSNEVFDGWIVGERVVLLQPGAHTLTLYNGNANRSLQYAVGLVPLASPQDLTPGAAAAGGDIAVAGERDYHRFSAVAGQGYTLRVSADFDGAVYVRRLPGSGNFTDRAATTIVTFPRDVASGVALEAGFTIPADQGGVYIIEVDAAQGQTGAYTVQLTSP